MIPRIEHSRSQLKGYLNPYDNGSHSIAISADTYPDLFALQLPSLMKKVPNGWKQNPGSNMKSIWFPPGTLSEVDIEEFEEWKSRFATYVLIGKNDEIEFHFDDELDFCMALDFNKKSAAGPRTHIGEAEYQYKYQQSKEHGKILVNALKDAFEDLPVPIGSWGDVAFTSVPSDPDSRNVARVLAKKVSRELDVDYLQSKLLVPKPQMKSMAVNQKIPTWKELYEDEDNIEIDDAQDKTIIIVDDLYQSGATMWCYASHLKEQGAEYVLGLACVKSLRDTDNQ